VHTFTAQEIDSAGHVVASSGSAILGSTGSNTLKSTSGNDYFVGDGGVDTFAFSAGFGNDVIKDFGATGRSHDVIQFSKSVFDSFASVLAHATQVGQDVVISADAGDSVTLKNTKLTALDRYDFHFA
jgi:Ca2+-binding RTX toxin-like protein